MMKICDSCGFNDWKPKDKCPKCKRKYTGYSCNPLADSTKDYIGSVVGEGNYYTKPPQYEKDEK
jgi:hypothetical protein